MVLLPLLFGIDIYSKEYLDSQLQNLVKLFIGLCTMAYLTKIMMREKSGKTALANLKIIKENLYIKNATYLLASPDEIANALTDPLIRPQWDPSISSVIKTSEDTIKVTYQNVND